MRGRRKPTRSFRPSDSFSWRVTAASVGAVLALGVTGLRVERGRLDGIPSPQGMTWMSYEAARPVLRVFQGRLPSGLAGVSEESMPIHWLEWAAARDAAIRARLIAGEEDSVVNLWLFGTSFTTHPRATAPALRALPTPARAAVLQARLEDLLDALVAPGENERLWLARRAIVRNGTDLTTRDGRDQAARNLAGLRQRMMGELQRFQDETRDARASDDDYAALDAYESYYRKRGLSSDTSLLASYAVERALELVVPLRLRHSASVSRVAIIGPGLDFVDKAEGHDFYPLQSIQPFAAVDSLVRLGLAAPDGVRVTTFDISPWVIDHLARARQRAEDGHRYLMHLPLERDDPTHVWHPDLVAYWQRLGNWIGTETPAAQPPQTENGIRIRAVRVNPDIVRAVSARDGDIVLQRPALPARDDRFDVVVATNILVYYDSFERTLALENIAAMLRPGGLLLTNSVVWPLPSTGLLAASPVTVEFDRQGGGDTMYWFRRVGG